MNYDLLIVDDSKAALFLFKKIIGLSGIPINTLLTAGNGVEALDVLRSNHVHLVLTDINMPEMDGFELIRRVKNDPNLAHIPVVVITTEGREKFIEQANELGSAGYLKKPFQPEQVKKLVLEILGVEENEQTIIESEECDF